MIYIQNIGLFREISKLYDTLLMILVWNFRIMVSPIKNLQKYCQKVTELEKDCQKVRGNYNSKSKPSYIYIVKKLLTALCLRIKYKFSWRRKMLNSDLFKNIINGELLNYGIKKTTKRRNMWTEVP